jgi:hypothetical protein
MRSKQKVGSFPAVFGRKQTPTTFSLLRGLRGLWRSILGEILCLTAGEVR